jgi:hypothetical protein
MMALYQQIHQQMESSSDMSLSIENKRCSTNNFPDLPQQLADLTLQVVSVAAQTDIDSEAWQRIWERIQTSYDAKGPTAGQPHNSPETSGAKQPSDHFSNAAVQTERPTSNPDAQATPSANPEPPLPLSVPSTSQQQGKAPIGHPHPSAIASDSQATRTYPATHRRSHERGDEQQQPPSHGTSRHQPHPPHADAPPAFSGMQGRHAGMKAPGGDGHRQAGHLPRYCVYCGEPLVKEVMERMGQGRGGRRHPSSSLTLCSSCPTSSNTSSEELHGGAGPTPAPFRFDSSLFNSTIGTRSTASLPSLSDGIPLFPQVSPFVALHLHPLCTHTVTITDSPCMLMPGRHSLP